MEVTLFEEFEKSASARSFIAPKKRIAEGETGWLAGVPVPAREDGCVSFAVSSGAIVTVLKEDIVEVQQKGEMFYLRVQAGAQTVVSTESVLTLGSFSGGSDCLCGDHESPGTVRILRPVFGRPFNGAGGGVFANDDDGPPACRFEWRKVDCSTLDLPEGNWTSCYEKVMVCGDDLLPPTFD